jgi:hypothetical protein
MDARYIFSALVGVFCLAAIVATITTYRHIANKPVTTISQVR